MARTDTDKGIYCRICKKRIWDVADIGAMPSPGTWLCLKCAPKEARRL